MTLRFDHLRGVAAPLRRANVDTDQIIPARFLTTLTREGLGKGLFHSLRFGAENAERPEFVLNRERYRAAKILIALENFGCGSSREHAPWALADFGIRCVVAPSFADIFAANCRRNGILLVTLDARTCETLLDLAEGPSGAEWSVDLPSQLLLCPGPLEVSFEIDPVSKAALLAGEDEIQVTLREAARIAEKERARVSARPWLPTTTRPRP